MGDGIPFGERDLMSPLSEDRLLEVVEALGEGGAEVFDLGCGKGALLRRLASRRPIRGRGIERSEELVREARRRALLVPLVGSLTFDVADLASFRPVGAPDVLVCMGSSGALGPFPDALRQLAGWVRPGGLLLADCGYWKQPPATEYLAVLGATADEYRDEEWPARLGAERGLSLRTSWRATLEEWDAFEEAYASAIEQGLRERPGDAGTAEKERWVASWRDAYRRFGRDTLGWGLHLFQRDA